MRTNILKSIFFLGIILLSACQSQDKMPTSSTVAFPLLTLDATSGKKIESGVLNAKFKIDMYYKDYPVDSRVVIAMNGKYSNLKIFNASIKTFPATLTLTDAQLVQLFGLTTINTGDYFQVGLDVLMADGKWYPAFDASGVTYSSGPSNLPGANPIIKFKAVCKLNIDEFVGTATISDSYWYGGDYTTPIVKVDATHLKIKNFALLSNGGDITMTIDPDTYIVTVTKQVMAPNLADWGLANYTNPTVTGKGEIDPCTRTIKLTGLQYAVDQGAFSPDPGSVVISY